MCGWLWRQQQQQLFHNIIAHDRKLQVMKTEQQSQVIDGKLDASNNAN